MVAGLQDPRAVVRIKGKGLFTSTGINNGLIRGRRKGNRTHGERSVLVADGGPMCTGVGRSPDSAHRPADEHGIPRSIGRIHRDGHDPPGHWGKESSSRRSWPDGRPGGRDRTQRREPGLRSHLRIRTIRAHGQFALRRHHALHMLKRFEARAGRNSAIRRAALLIEPFISLADLLRSVLGFFAVQRSLGFIRAFCGRYWRRLLLEGGGF